jgi:hypothetical protein
VRLFDARRYPEKGIFRELLDIRLFKTAKVFDGGFMSRTFAPIPFT